ncbi:hypothetical protein Cs7R123_26510 [Catellatospora sp. TT07R-123]|uniref:ATP-grasp domain-containing protein n=1 Tax=Catellatospora sp. TT07R-123 TaxID=2733863 RepID=UPI001B2ABB8E|nr:ATP-grasp domain-containing protein [Catellatospora sp. TT07R-123]GHJ45309.1 hypothetical protein Cs7R123_26510 [Catellatospora sp. TT07R-123]
MRLLMIGVDPTALEGLPATVDVTVLMGALNKDQGDPIPDRVRTVFVDDQKNVDSALNGLYRAGFGEGSFDAVYAFDDPQLMTAAALGALLGANAVPAPTVALFRDKSLQKRRIAEAGLPVTGYAVIDDIRELPDGFTMPFARGVLKPVAGMATQSTYVVENQADLVRISAQCRAGKVSARNFLLEEFVPGDEWFADGIMSDGHIRFLALGRYAQPCLSAVQQRSPVQTFSFDPTADKWAFDLARPLIEQSIAALGLVDGIFHLEMFHQPENGRVVFSECGARRGGGPIRDQIRYKYGVDLGEYGPLALLQPLPEIPTRIREGVVASTFLPLKPGVIVGFPTAAEIAAQPDVARTRLYVPVGKRIEAAAANTFYRMGEVTVHTADAATAERRLTELAAWFTDRIDVVALNPTLRELFADPRNAGFQYEAGTID